MHSKTDVREFLTSRRAKITPKQAGLAAGGGKRRVPGLRREEVALLAGVSIEYYARLERGSLGGVSDSVLEAITHALQLDEAERTHLFDLARTANTTTRARRKPQQQVTPSIQRILDGMTSTPAVVENGRLDILAVNRLGRALYSPVLEVPARPANFARFAFFDSRATEFYRDWNGVANTTAALLQAEAGRAPYDKALSDLIGELCTRSEEFRTRYAARNVRLHCTGTKPLHHPVVGDLEPTFDSMELSSTPGLRLIGYTAEPGSASQDALNLLASWAATLDQDGRSETTHHTDAHTP